MNRKGFTLIELLIVVAIIGILAAGGVSVIPGLLESAKEKASRANHKQVVQFIQASIMKCHLDDELILKHNPWGIDVSSGIEATKRKKSFTLMKKFIENVKIADNEKNE